MSFTELKQAIVVDLEFTKPNVKSTILKVDSDGFHYSIGQKGNSKKVMTFSISATENYKQVVNLVESGLMQHFLQLQRQLYVISRQSVAYSNTLGSLPIKNPLTLKRKRNLCHVSLGMPALVRKIKI